MTKKKKRVKKSTESKTFSFCTNCGSINVKSDRNALLNRFGAGGSECLDCGAVFQILPKANLSSIQSFASRRKHQQRIDQQSWETRAVFGELSLYYGLVLWIVLITTIMWTVKGFNQQLIGVVCSTLFVWALLFTLLHVSKTKHEKRHKNRS